MAGDLLHVLLPVLVGLALVGIASLVARHGWRHRHSRLFAALYFLSGLKSISEGIGPVADGLRENADLFPPSQAWFVAGSLCALAMTPVLLLFVASFPRPTAWIARRPAVGLLAFVPSVLVGLVLFTARSQADLFAAVLAFSLFSSGVTALALALLVRARASSPDRIERQQATYVIVGFLPSFAATWCITTLYALATLGVVRPEAAQGILGAVVSVASPLLELLAASAVALAILKYQLLGVNPRFRLGVKSALVAALFASVFLVTQFVESRVLEGRLFSFAGDYSFLVSAVTGLVLFKPIERVSERTAERLLPSERGRDLSRAAEVYHAQCAYVLRDATVTDRERAFLANLRDQLGLSPEEARRIEQEVETLLKVDAPETGASAGPLAGQGPAPPGTT